METVGTDWRVTLHFALKKQGLGWVNMAQNRVKYQDLVKI